MSQYSKFSPFPFISDLLLIIDILTLIIPILITFFFIFLPSLKQNIIKFINLTIYFKFCFATFVS